jgi:hypothetical protein
MYMDLVNCVLGPFLLIILFSCLLIRANFKPRNRIHINNSVREHKSLKQDIKFAITSLLMNLFFILLQLPVEICFRFCLIIF